MKGRANPPDEPKGAARRDGAPYPLTQAAFEQALAQAKQDLRGLVPKLGDWLKETFTLRLALETPKQSYPGLADDLATLLPADFLRRMPYARVQHLPRYLRGMQARTEKWKRDAAKDALRASELAPFVAAVRRFAGGAGLSRDGSGRKAPPTVDLTESFRWLVEEYRVSLFAQELGTAEPVSAVRLQRALAELEVGRANPPDEPQSTARRDDSPHPKPAPVTSGKKRTPLKSLGSLDQLFRK